MYFSLVTIRASGAPDAPLAATQPVVTSLNSQKHSNKFATSALSDRPLLTCRLQRAPERLYCLPKVRESAAELASKLGARCLSGAPACAWDTCNNFHTRACCGWSVWECIRAKAKHAHGSKGAEEQAVCRRQNVPCSKRAAHARRSVHTHSCGTRRATHTLRRTPPAGRQASGYLGMVRSAQNCQFCVEKLGVAAPEVCLWGMICTVI